MPIGSRRRRTTPGRLGEEDQHCSHARKVSKMLLVLITGVRCFRRRFGPRGLEACKNVRLSWVGAAGASWSWVTSKEQSCSEAITRVIASESRTVAWRLQVAVGTDAASKYCNERGMSPLPLALLMDQSTWRRNRRLNTIVTSMWER